ncbi:MAG: paraquat-inducible protein A [Pseudomonadota bacterium]
MSKTPEHRQRAIDALNRDWLACPHCDALWRRPQLSEGERVKCGHCHSIILHNKHRSAERTIALMLASLILYAVAVTFPFMRMERSGIFNEISVIDSILVLWDNGMPNIAVICAAFVLLFPLSRIVLLFFVGISLYGKKETGRPHAWSFRFAQMLEPWTMAEIFMIGVIVSLVKVGKLADITLGPAFWAMSGLIVILAMGASAVCRDTIWQNIRRMP